MRALGLWILVGVGCSETTPPSPVPIAQTVQIAVDAGDPHPVQIQDEYTESDFVESEKNRDPFRSYASMYALRSTTTVNQRLVILNQYSVDELKLIGIVLSGDEPKAMVVDPTGKGWVLKRGDYVARTELVRLGAQGAEYPVNWRVDRMRAEEVILIRRDPSQSEAAAATRTIFLHPEADPSRASLP